MKRNIPLFYPHIPKKAILKELAKTLSSRWVGEGPRVKEFEQAIGKKWKYKYPLMVNSCTSALELAYHLIGLKEEDEVIVPILDCTAGQMGLLRRGVKIVFADIDENLNISYEDVKRKITKHTKAVIIVHLGGIEADKRIYQLCKKLSIPVIVDAAQYHAPTWGDYICYSFQAIKHITTGDGGLLVLKDRKTYIRAKKLRWFGIDREKKIKNHFQAWKNRAMTFDIFEAGYKYQPTDIDATLGLVGLKELDKVIAYRKKLCLIYEKELKNTEITMIYGDTYWLFGILADKRDALAKHLEKKGIDTNLVHLRNDIFTIFGGKRQKLPHMNSVEPLYLYLPLNTRITETDVRYLCKEIRNFYELQTA